MTTLRHYCSSAVMALLSSLSACGGNVEPAGDRVDSGANDSGGNDSASDGSGPGTPDAHAVEDVYRDPGSGLTWQVRATFPELSWSAATAHCEKLVWAGHDDWRLPNIDELRTLIRGCPDTETGGACGETVACSGAGPRCYDGEACMGCSTGAGPGSGGCFWPTEMGNACVMFWSSTPADDAVGYPCFAHFGVAHLSHDDERNAVGHHALCVR